MKILKDDQLVSIVGGETIIQLDVEAMKLGVITNVGARLPIQILDSGLSPHDNADTANSGEPVKLDIKVDALEA